MISLIRPSACLLTTVHCCSPVTVRIVSFVGRTSPEKEHERLSTRTSTKHLDEQDDSLVEGNAPTMNSIETIDYWREQHGCWLDNEWIVVETNPCLVLVD